MKKIFLPIFLLVFLAACSSIVKTTSIEMQNLKGKVKILKETRYNAEEEFDEIPKEDMRYWVTTMKVFDEKGNLIEQIQDDSDGNMYYKWTLKYDEKGNIEGNEYSADGSLNRKEVYKYAEKGNLIEMSGYDFDGSLMYKFVYKYDNKRHLIEHSLYNPDGNLREKSIYKYDNKGNKIEEDKYHSNGSLDYTLAYKYDKKGNVIDEGWYNRVGNLIPQYTYKYEYDEKNNWIKKIKYDDDVATVITVREIEYY